MIIPKIIYSDDRLLVLDKPPGLVVDPAESVKGETLADILQKDFNIKLFRGGIAHRLDKDTSGLILIAKTQAVLENLQSQFKERIVKKEYLALVHGHIKDIGIVDASIIRNPLNREKFTVASQGVPLEARPACQRLSVAMAGREAVTEYEPVKLLVMSSELIEKIFEGFNKIQLRKLRTMNYQLYTLLKCKPKTGRTHQIRVHLKYINHPIVSDEKYSGRKMNRLDKRWCPRMFLHAAKIGFKHPVSGEWMELESELPEDLEKALSLLSSQI
ncbi:MAG: RluA family pseudouridine synthase [Candidatus Daviesbacteria bacterium]|nr:RluA family pseudouridine synthase [Candidatus Daviesbacteria bacterium]